MNPHIGGSSFFFGWQMWWHCWCPVRRPMNHVRYLMLLITRRYRFGKRLPSADPTSKGYSLLRYEMKGLQCADKTVLFSTTKGNATNCQKTRSCEVVKRMPRSRECFRICQCDAGHCQSTVVVEPMINQIQWSLCPLRLA